MMLWILIGFILLVTIVPACFKKGSDCLEWLGGAFVTSTILSVLLLAITFFSVDATAGSNPKPVRVSSVELKSMSDGTGIKGRTFLTTGYINSERRLNYVTKDTDGGLLLKSMYAGNAKIFERNGETPRLDAWKFERSMPAIVPWTWMTDEIVYWFWVPEGSVTGEFRVDNNG